MNVVFFTTMDETYNAVLKGKLVQLDAYKLEQSSNIRQRLWITKGRLGVGMNEMFGYAELPVLIPGTRAAELIMIHAHNQHQRGTKDTFSECSFEDYKILTTVEVANSF